MNEKLESMLNSMEGRNINIYLCGMVTNYQMFKSFEFWMENLLTGDKLVLSSEGEEKYFYISLDDIKDIKIYEEINEVRFLFDDDNLIQVWIDME